MADTLKDLIEKSTAEWFAPDGLRCYPYPEVEGKYALVAIKNNLVTLGVVTASTNTVRPLGTLYKGPNEGDDNQTDLLNCMVYKTQVLDPKDRGPGK